MYLPCICSEAEVMEHSVQQSVSFYFLSRAATDLHLDPSLKISAVWFWCDKLLIFIYRPFMKVMLCDLLLWKVETGLARNVKENKNYGREYSAIAFNKNNKLLFLHYKRTLISAVPERWAELLLFSVKQ